MITVQHFCLEPSSTGFWKPQEEMNVASGCPKFAPLSVLDYPSYVGNVILYCKAIIVVTSFTYNEQCLWLIKSSFVYKRRSVKEQRKHR